MMIMDPLIAKLHSSGNSFLICFGHQKKLTDQIPRLCNPHFGLGGDGLVLVTTGAHIDEFHLSFFNNDGSSFRMCFNGTLCAAFFLLAKKKFEVKVLIMPNLQKLYVTTLKDKIRLVFNIPIAKYIFEEISIGEFKGICYSVFYEDNHKVFLTDDPSFFKLPHFIKLAKKLREPNEVFSNGANVHFIFHNNTDVYIRHFEKGIENETLSCGSGCVAAAIILSLEHALTFKSPGGSLIISKKNSKKWAMVGSPELIADIYLC